MPGPCRQTPEITAGPLGQTAALSTSPWMSAFPSRRPEGHPGGSEPLNSLIPLGGELTMAVTPCSEPVMKGTRGLHSPTRSTSSAPGPPRASCHTYDTGQNSAGLRSSETSREKGQCEVSGTHVLIRVSPGGYWEHLRWLQIPS